MSNKPPYPRLWQRLGLRWNPFRSWGEEEVAAIWESWGLAPDAVVQLACNAVVELVGPTGSGKSTFCAAVCQVARSQGIPVRHLYLPPDARFRRGFVWAVPGELLVIDEADRLAGWLELLLELLHRHVLYGLVLTRHRPGRRRLRAVQGPLRHARTNSASAVSDRDVALRSPPVAGRAALADKVIHVNSRKRYTIRIPPFDAVRIRRFFRRRLEWAGGGPLTIGAAACDWLARAAGGNGRIVQWSLYELFQTRLPRLPRAIDVPHVRIGLSRQQEAVASECPGCYGGGDR